MPPFQGDSALPPYPENDRPSYPRAQAPQDQLKTARFAQNQPNIKSDEDNFKTSRTQTQICRLSTQTVDERQLAVLFPSSPRMD